MLDWLKWLLFDAGFLSPDQRYWIGFLVSLACFGITSYFFAKEVKDNPRLFTVLALFASGWVAVASGYQARHLLYAKGDNIAFILADLTGDLASIIMVFAGAVLAREAPVQHWFLNSQRLQVAAMSLFAAVVIPRQFPSEWIAPRITGVVLSDTLNLVGYLALGLGAKAVAKPSQFRGLLLILVVYAMLEIGRDLQVMIVTPRPDMSDFFMFGFAAAKVLLTLSFGYIVLWHHEQLHASSGQAARSVAPQHVAGSLPPSASIDAPASATS